MTRRTFTTLSTVAAGMVVVPALAGDTPVAADEKLQSELLFDLVFEKGPASSVGSRVVVGIAGGTFEGPKLKGTVAAPSGDWIVGRADGSSTLDIRILLQTDDAQKILMTCRGIAYVPQGGSLYARILPMFETGAAKYAWMNNIVAAGVYRPVPGKVAYRVYQIL
jgi:Protein of unknown function (DUF3237)